MAMKKSVLLDVDPTIMENNLLITNPDDLQSLYPPATKTKLTQPIPGMCVKLRTVADNSKVFINICHSRDIPPPEDIDEKKLIELWGKETVSYRVPLSIAEARKELDKTETPVDVYDVCISTDFYGRSETSNIFKLFTIDVIIHAVEDKFHRDFDKDGYTVLKKRKCLGNIPPHRVRVSQGNDGNAIATPLVQEMETTYVDRDIKPGGSVLNPEYRLVQIPATGHPETIIAQIKLPKITHGKQVNLDIGEDRILLSGSPPYPNYHLDIFLPHRVVQKSSSATFDFNTMILTVTMPAVQPPTKA